MILTMDTLQMIKMYFFKSIKIVKIIAYPVSYWCDRYITSDKNDQKDQNDNKFINQEWSWLMILTINTIQMIKMYFYFLNISDQDAIIDAQLLKMTKNSDHITFILIKMYFQDIIINQRYWVSMVFIDHWHMKNP